MIQVSQLRKSYGDQVIFDDAGFVLSPGERVGLVGRNGHGKTTLFRILLGEEPPDTGIISIPNNYAIGHLSQHIRFTENTALKEVCLSLKVSEDGRDETYKTEAILLGLGFTTEDFQRHPDEFSGGYQVRLNLAKVLVSEPALLLLDEPTNYLDILSIRWLKGFLRTWKNELMLITHDRNFMDSVTTHTLGIHRCKIRKIEGSTHKLYEQIIQEEEIFEQTRQNDEKKRKQAEQFITRFRAKASKARAVQSRIKALEKRGALEKLSDIRNLDFEFRTIPLSGKWPIQTENLSFSFDAHGPLLIDNLSFFSGKKDRIGIIGKNGKGKTTLLNLLAGELTPTTGQIITHANTRTAYFGQTNIDRLDPGKTVEQEILDVQADGNRKAARSICGAMMFDGDKALKKISVLSGGEKSRVLLGKLLVRPANLLLLDEPTNHLDMESTESLLEAIEAFEGAVMIVTHSEMILQAVATRLIVFDGGKACLFEGTYQDFLDRVGWADEAGERSGHPMKGPVKNRPVNKKEERRIRAELVAERSRVLGRLQKRIAEIEKTIMGLEKEMAKNTGALLKASQEGGGEKIQELSKSIHLLNEKIETHFSALEALTGEHDNEARAFDEKFGTG